jgi:hypothetical protein
MVGRRTMRFDLRRVRHFNSPKTPLTSKRQVKKNHRNLTHELLDNSASTVKFVNSYALL